MSYLQQDVPLFDGIVQDLFPSEKDSSITTDQTLEAAIQKTLEENNLQVGQWVTPHRCSWCAVFRPSTKILP